MASYAQAIAAAPSLVSWWKLDETSGTVAADSKGANPGVYTGGFTLNQTGFGLSGAGVLFNGSTGYVTIPTSATLEITGAFSIEALVKMTNASRSSQYTQIAGKDHSAFSSPYQNYALQAEFGGGQWFGGAIGQAGAVQTTVHSNAVPVAGVWHQIVFTYDPSPAHNNLNIYFDGALDNYQSNGIDKQGALSNAAQPFMIGAGNFGGTINSFLPATVSNVSVANAAWSAGEVLAHYNAISGSADTAAISAVTEPHDAQVAAVVNTFGATISLAEALDVMVASEPSHAALLATARRDTAVMIATGAGGFVFPVTRPDGICRWFPGLRPSIRRARARI